MKRKSPDYEDLIGRPCMQASTLVSRDWITATRVPHITCVHFYNPRSWYVLIEGLLISSSDTTKEGKRAEPWSFFVLKHESNEMEKNKRTGVSNSMLFSRFWFQQLSDIHLSFQNLLRFQIFETNDWDNSWSDCCKHRYVSNFGIVQSADTSVHCDPSLYPSLKKQVLYATCTTIGSNEIK